MLTENCLPIAVFFTEMKQNVKVMYVPFEKQCLWTALSGAVFLFQDENS